jgi:DNA adenine methylase
MISYIGGKYKQASWMYDYIPDTETFNEYAEVFGGAYWFYLRTDMYKNVKKAYYNDFNRLMVNMFTCAKPENVYSFLDQIDKDGIKSQDSKLFESFRDEVYELENSSKIDTFKIPDFKLAYKYPYLLTQVFSGTAIKSNTKMTDLKGKYKSKFDAFLNRVKNPDIQKKLAKVETSNMDFEKFIQTHDKEDIFIYLDPPYYDTETYYGFHQFGKEDHLRLAEAVKKMKGKFMISYYDFPDLEKWFPRYQYRWVEKDFAKSGGAVKGKKTNTGTEVLIMNY